MLSQNNVFVTIMHLILSIKFLDIILANSKNAKGFKKWVWPHSCVMEFLDRVLTDTKFALATWSLPYKQTLSKDLSGSSLPGPGKWHL